MTNYDILFMHNHFVLVTTIIMNETDDEEEIELAARLPKGRARRARMCSSNTRMLTEHQRIASLRHALCARRVHRTHTCSSSMEESIPQSMHAMQEKRSTAATC